MGHRALFFSKKLIYGNSLEKNVCSILIGECSVFVFVNLMIHFMAIHFQGCESFPLWIKKRNTCAGLATFEGSKANATGHANA